MVTLKKIHAARLHVSTRVSEATSLPRAGHALQEEASSARVDVHTPLARSLPMGWPPMDPSAFVALTDVVLLPSPATNCVA